MPPRGREGRQAAKGNDRCEGVEPRRGESRKGKGRTRRRWRLKRERERQNERKRVQDAETHEKAMEEGRGREAGAKMGPKK